MFDAVIEFPKFKLGVRTLGEHVVEIRYLPAAALSVQAKNAVAEEAARQLERYRDDPDATFDFPVKIEGTPLERGVWEAMCAIPRGATRTYGEIAKELGAHFPVTARDIGQACGENRLPIVIPCHRVVAAGCKPGGFSAAGIRPQRI